MIERLPKPCAQVRFLSGASHVRRHVFNRPRVCRARTSGGQLGRLELGKALLRWFRGSAHKNGYEVPMTDFIAWLESGTPKKLSEGAPCANRRLADTPWQARRSAVHITDSPQGRLLAA